MLSLRLTIAAAVATALSAPAAAQLLPPAPASCTLTLGIGGTLAPAADGMSLSTRATGAAPASLTMIAANLVPVLTFTAPTVVGPPGWGGTPTTMIAVESPSGVRQPLTSSGFTVRPGALIEMLRIDAHVSNPAGLRAGSYRATTEVTCQAG